MLSAVTQRIRSLQSLYNVQKLLIFLSSLRASLRGRVEPIDEASDQSALLQFAIGGLLVVPVLVVVEIGPFFAETRLLDDFIPTKFGTEIAWSIVVIEAAVTEMDVTVSSCAVSLPPRYVLRSAPKASS